jgi:hypothetical protein
MADTVTKICMDIYRKFEKSRVLNVIEDLQIPDILEICYLYNLLWICINPGIHFLFVLYILKSYSFWERCLIMTHQLGHGALVFAVSPQGPLHAFCNKQWVPRTFLILIPSEMQCRNWHLYQGSLIEVLWY